MSFHDTGMEPDFEPGTHRLHRRIPATVRMHATVNGLDRTGE